MGKGPVNESEEGIEQVCRLDNCVLGALHFALCAQIPQNQQLGKYKF